MVNEAVLADTVRRWALEVLPNEGVADRAVGVALSAYRGGASVSEATFEARRFMLSWASHPAHGAAISRMRQRLAS